MDITFSDIRNIFNCHTQVDEAIALTWFLDADITVIQKLIELHQCWRNALDKELGFSMLNEISSIITNLIDYSFQHNGQLLPEVDNKLKSLGV